MTSTPRQPTSATARTRPQRCGAGLGVLHALAEQMADALAEANGDDALAVEAGLAAA